MKCDGVVPCIDMSPPLIYRMGILLATQFPYHNAVDYQLSVLQIMTPMGITFVTLLMLYIPHLVLSVTHHTFLHTHIMSSVCILCIYMNAIFAVVWLCPECAIMFSSMCSLQILTAVKQANESKLFISRDMISVFLTFVQLVLLLSVWLLTTRYTVNSLGIMYMSLLPELIGVFTRPVILFALEMANCCIFE